MKKKLRLVRETITTFIPKNEDDDIARKELAKELAERLIRGGFIRFTTDPCNAPSYLIVRATIYAVGIAQDG